MEFSCELDGRIRKKIPLKVWRVTESQNCVIECGTGKCKHDYGEV